jgi:hypothetical protein
VLQLGLEVQHGQGDEELDLQVQDEHEWAGILRQRCTCAAPKVKEENLCYYVSRGGGIYTCARGAVPHYIINSCMHCSDA